MPVRRRYSCPEKCMNATAHGWAVRLSIEDRHVLAALRLLAGVEVAVVGESIWVRGPVAERAAATAADRLPASARFALLADGVLRPPGASVPRARLPRDVTWVGLRSWIEVELPALLPPARSVERLPLRLVRGGAEAVPDAMLLGLDTWAQWAESAPAVRLAPLRFAAATALALDGLGPAQALVLGEPLPPLPGVRLNSRAGILVPAGWRWEPAVSAATVRGLLGLRTDELALWPDVHAPVSMVPAEAVVPASRSAARLTREGAKGNLPIDEA